VSNIEQRAVSGILHLHHAVHSQHPSLHSTVQMCAECSRKMRLVSVEPHARYRNLDTRNIACECGATHSDAVARPEFDRFS